MLLNGRKTIGVFISSANSECQAMLCRGISTRANEVGYNVVYYNNFIQHDRDMYSAGQRQIVDLPDLNQLEGIIIMPDTYNSEEMLVDVKHRIDARTNGCPVVSVRGEQKEYYNVLIDNTRIMEESIEHYLTVHHFTRLVFLAGPKGFPDSDKRLESFRKVMHRHGIKVDESMIYYGDFWKKKGYEAVDYFFAQGKQWPQAVICANDYMAVTVCNALFDKGIRVPEDVAVSGTDDINLARNYSPTLTTAGMPFFSMGATAVNKIVSHNTGMEQEKDTYLSTYTVYRESCGCKKNLMGMNQLGRKLIAQYDDLRNAYNANGRMTSDLNGIGTLEDLCKKVEYYAYENRNFDRFTICLSEDWMTIDRPSGLTDRMILLDFVDNISAVPIYFDRRELIPDLELLEVNTSYGTPLAISEPQIFYVNILQYDSNVFGYAVISFRGDQGIGDTYEAWLMNIGNALESIRMHTEMNRLVSELARNYTVDTLTGLYNRRGFAVLAEELITRNENAEFFVLCADLDSLKRINDSYGHAEGDIAIRTIAEAMQNAATNSQICARVGGDEYTVLGLMENADEDIRFTERFMKEVDAFNKEHKKEWNLGISYGIHRISPKNGDTLEDGMKIADRMLYRAKETKKKAQTEESTGQGN